MTDALETTAGSTTLALILGDITLLHVDAIVNAANSGLRGGGGVDGAIHRAGGPQILEECRTIVAAQGPCPTGQAVITSGGHLKARRVIHAVGPIWHGGAAEEDRLLADAYRNSLALARRHGLKTVAFPSISTGVYGFPIERAASIAYSTVCTVVEREPWFTRVVFVAYTDSGFEVYARLFVTETPRTT